MVPRLHVTVVGAGHLPDVHHSDDGLISILIWRETCVKSKTSVLITLI